MHVCCPGHHLARGHAKAYGNTYRKWMVYETAFLGLAETDSNKIGCRLEAHRCLLSYFAGNDYDDDCNEKYDIPCLF